MQEYRIEDTVKGKQRRVARRQICKFSAPQPMHGPSRPQFLNRLNCASLKGCIMHACNTGWASTPPRYYQAPVHILVICEQTIQLGGIRRIWNTGPWPCGCVGSSKCELRMELADASLAIQPHGTIEGVSSPSMNGLIDSLTALPKNLAQPKVTQPLVFIFSGVW